MTQGDQNVLFDYAPFGKSCDVDNVKTSMVNKTKVTIHGVLLHILGNGNLCCEILKVVG